MAKALQITNVDILKGYGKGQVVELPPFGDEQPFIARLKRPSMLVLAKAGKVPNELLTSANQLFAHGGKMLNDYGDDGLLSKLFEIMDVMCEASFVEPSYSELKDSGIELTDEQYMAVFNYAQNGVRALKSFRNIEGDNADIEYEHSLQDTSE